MPLPPPVLPLRASPEWSRGDYWLVHDATGRCCGIGPRDACEQAVAEQHFIPQPDLFDDCP